MTFATALTAKSTNRGKMQVLKLADDLFGPLRSAEKFTTIRKGRRDVALGELCFEGADDVELTEVVTVRSVTFTALGWVPFETLEADGFKDHDDMLEQMKRFYPNITFETEVTVVNFSTLCPACTAHG